MNYFEVFIATSGIEIVSGLLLERGISGLIIEDKGEIQSFMDNPNREWDYIEDGLIEEKMELPEGITFYLEESLESAETISELKNSLTLLKEQETTLDLGSLDLTVKNVQERDWANNWKKYFKPFPVGERILIKPSWEEFSEPTERRILEIDPGQIFGTGSHETTQGCLELIETYVKTGDRVLDIGCGSGILAIAGLLLGAGYADAVDIDPNAVKIVRENMEMNGLAEERYHVYAGDILNDSVLIEQFTAKKYNVVQANIVADIIIALLAVVPGFLSDNGLFIMSGIIAQREVDVLEALARKGFKVLEVHRKNDWVAIAAQKVED